ncbi:restriction endonuclease [Streptomyces sp. DH12]|uniref:restriction endonuclease n=1 Tax=Streptomyces sp. DH12 TaxID=2857010 RepID=UPI001E4A03BC|nr:restriction endonuclease [Streptomyces sp. DH12]
MTVPQRTTRRPRAGWRDVVLAVGLVGVAVGGLAVWVRTAWAPPDGVFGPGLLLVTVVLAAVVAGRGAARRTPGRVPRAPVPAQAAAPDEVTAVLPAGGAAQAPPVPRLDGDSVDHEDVDPYGFEHTVAALCVRDGCTRTEVSGGPGDLGADVVATAPDGRRLVVQCKQYAADNPVGSQDLQRFGGTCFAVHEAEVAVVVTTSTFTAPAAEYAAAIGIVCVDGEALAAWTDGRTPPPWEGAATTPTA